MRAFILVAAAVAAASLAGCADYQYPDGSQTFGQYFARSLLRSAANTSISSSTVKTDHGTYDTFGSCTYGTCTGSVTKR